MTLLKLIATLSITLALGACTSTSPRWKALKQARLSSTTALSASPLAQALERAEQTSQTPLSSKIERLAYRKAVEAVVEQWIAQRPNDAEGEVMDVQSGDLTYRIEPHWASYMRFDELIPASSVPTKKLRERIVFEGVGAPMIARWIYSEERKLDEPLMTRDGYLAPVTATLDFDDSNSSVRRVRLRLHDPSVERIVRIGTASRPLAADYSAPTEWLLTNELNNMPKLGALLNPAKNLDRVELQSLEPAAPGRVPLIFVHGLASKPATWKNVYNELQNDPELCRNYQVYFYRYPTGVPVIYSAARLREQMVTLHQKMVAAGNVRLSGQMILVGHSMGGLVSRLLTQSSGDRLWVLFFGKPREELSLNDDEVKALRIYLEFEPNPYVSRVVFIATPHRGSELADHWMVTLIRKFINLPSEILDPSLGPNVPAHGDKGTLKRMTDAGVHNSLEDLSPNSDFVKNCISLPMRPGLKLHSIIGNKDGHPLQSPKSGDGVVPYSSAHLDGVQSELVVKSDHSAHENPEAIQELKRILKIHLHSLR